MKKVLIWDDFPMSNMGGPMGYCYNIHEFLKIYPTQQITFLSDLLPQEERGTWGNAPKPKSQKKLKIQSILSKLHLLNIYFYIGNIKNTIKIFLL